LSDNGFATGATNLQCPNDFILFVDFDLEHQPVPNITDTVHRPKETPTDQQRQTAKLLKDSELLVPTQNRLQQAEQLRSTQSSFSGFEAISLISQDKQMNAKQASSLSSAFEALQLDVKTRSIDGTTAKNSLAAIDDNILPPVHVDLQQFRFYENNDKLTMRDVNHQRGQLIALAGAHGLNTKEFVKNMDQLQARIPRDIKPSEVVGVYHHISELLEPDSKTNLPTSDKERAVLAWQILAQAADPHSINQGFHRTCNVASIENVIYSHHPSAAAKMLSELALTGGCYTDAYGASLQMSPHPRDFVGDEFTKVHSNTRSYASELFQVAAVNLYYQQKGKTHVHYEQTHVPNGEAHNKTGEGLYYDNKKVSDDPQFDPDASQLVPNVITGLSDAPRILQNTEIRHWMPKCAADSLLKWADQFSSEKEFEHKLAEIKARNGFPVILSVNAGNSPFVDDDPHLSGNIGGRHAITIQDYIPGSPGKVLFDNPWGEKFNHNIISKAVSVHEMYISSLEPEDARALWQKDVAAGIKSGRLNDYAELEELRLRWSNHALSTGQFANKLLMESDKIKDDQAQHRLSKDNFNRASTKSDGLMSALPLKLALPVTDVLYATGTYSQSRFAKHLNTFAKDLYRPSQKADFAHNYKELQELKMELPPVLQQQIDQTLVTEQKHFKRS
jgi:hypothetical protein